MTDGGIYSSTQTARKAHRCSDCERTIEPGERYDRGFSVWDGQGYTWKWCAHCIATVAILRSLDVLYDEGEGISIRQHVENVIDYRDAQSITEIRLGVCFRRKWRRRDGALMPIPTSPITSTEEQSS